MSKEILTEKQIIQGVKAALPWVKDSVVSGVLTPPLTFTHQGRNLKVVGTHKDENGNWTHDVKDMDTGEYKVKTDDWLIRATPIANSK